MVSVMSSSRFRMRPYLLCALTLLGLTASLPVRAPQAESAAFEPELAMVDRVPIFRKNGLLWKYGLDYQPIGRQPLVQDFARLHVTAERSIFAWTPRETETPPVDRVRIALKSGGGAVIVPFLSDRDGRTVLLAGLDGKGDCAGLTDGIGGIEDLGAAFGVEDDEIYRYFGQAVTCQTGWQAEDGNRSAIVLETPVEDISAIGLLTVGGAGSTVEVGELAAGHAGAPEAQRIGVTVTSAYEKSEPGISKLFLLRGKDGPAEEIAPVEPGRFEIDRGDIGDLPFQLWADDYGGPHYPEQGAWLDPKSLPASMSIRIRPDYDVVPDRKPEDSKRTHRPHRLRIWNGASNKPTQEYEGLTFTNNYGNADRDRFPENVNNCFRAVYFGGSHAETVQTRIWQKAGIIAEPLLEREIGRCVEILTFARETHTPENFVDYAREFVEDFGVDAVVVQLYSSNVCWMHDHASARKRGLRHLRRWRIVNGKPIPPDEAEAEAPDDEEKVAPCDFSVETPGKVERRMMRKMHDMDAYISSLDDQLVKTVFFDWREELIGRDSVTNNLKQLCAEFELNCQFVARPDEMYLPKDIGRYTRNLFWYEHDSHPNHRGNVLIADGLFKALLPIARKNSAN